MRTPGINLHFWGIFTDGDNWITLWCGSPRKVVGTRVARISLGCCLTHHSFVKCEKEDMTPSILVSVNHKAEKMSVFGTVVLHSVARRKYIRFKYKLMFDFTINFNCVCNNRFFVSSPFSPNLDVVRFNFRHIPSF